MNRFRLALVFAGLLMIPGAVGYCETQKIAGTSEVNTLPSERPGAAKAVEDEVNHQNALGTLGLGRARMDYARQSTGVGILKVLEARPKT